jgi:4-amino-4-deoxy-L-arabinose transferase-like glycosyltransferase
MPLRNANGIALALCLGFALLAIFYAASTPPFESPDEASHFLYAHNLQQTGQLPVLEDQDTVFASQSAQRHHPPLYYALGALLISLTQRGDLDAYLQLNPLASVGVVADNNLNVYLHPVPPPSGDTAFAVWIFRLFSIALSTGTVWLIYRAALLIAGRRIALLALLLVVSIPTFISISASINNDNLITLLHAAGVYCCLTWWQKRQISRWDMLLISLILSAVALTKINGLTLFATVYGWVILGAIMRRFRWRDAVLLIGASLVLVALLAGWWYGRNLQIYGDVLALNATLRIWGRGGAPHLVALSEANGIWESFWFTLGHFNVRGPGWLYDVYLPVVSVVAVLGLGMAFWREHRLRVILLFLLVIVLLAVAALLVATSRVDVSQGRILFPGLVAFAPLFAIGWTRLPGRRLGTLVSLLLVLPLTILALLTPFTILAQAFPAATIVDALPADVQPVDVSTVGLTVLGYERLTDTIAKDGWVRFNLYISGSHRDNPHLFVKALHPLNGDVLGGVDVYPGMMPTWSMLWTGLYAVPVRFRLDAAKLARYPAPCEDVEQPAVLLPLQDKNGTLVDAPLLAGPTVLNAVPPATPQIPLDVVFGGMIRLAGYSLNAEQLFPGDTLDVTLNWQYVAPIPEDLTVTIGLLDANGEILATADGGVPGYPTSAWRAGVPFQDIRTLTIPSDAAPGALQLYIGWYQVTDGLRLTAAGANILDNRYIIPLTLNACPSEGCENSDE